MAYTLSLIIPCYNEEKTIPLFYHESCKILNELKQKNISAEFIFIDDGSKDNTHQVIEEFGKTDDRVHCIIFSRNFGKEAAFLAGLQAATGEYIVTLDADLQDPPALIPQMLDAVLSGGFDCAGTRRVTRKGEPPIRSFFARRFYRIMAKLADIEVVDGARDFRLMSRPYVTAILSLNERNRFSKGIFPWVGFRTKWFEYENINRAAGETKWSFWKLFLYSLDGIIAFSTKPLAIASVCGIFMLFISLVFIVLIIVRKFVMGLPDSGWSSIVCFILFTSGIQLFCTGILGQYLARTYMEVKQRPHFVIREAK
jgi:glycosyltransferase involved in cell wall biosynthesis